jgi:predicted Fe-S protein YdhL (DUF1289 family)
MAYIYFFAKVLKGMILKIDTPCIGICSTVYGDKICRGCKRQFKEVIEWNGYDSEQKQEIYARLDQDMQNIVGQYLHVENTDLLRSFLEQNSIRYRDDQHPLSWALYALRHADTKIKVLDEIGIVVRAQYSSLSLTDLFNTLDTHLYRHCESNPAAIQS